MRRLTQKKKIKKKKTLKIYKGSGYLAEGNTACVFTDPPLHCEKKSNIIENIERELGVEFNELVSKVYPPENRNIALAEFKLGQIISIIDPENDICIFPLKILPPELKNKGCKIDADLEECSILTKKQLDSGKCTIIYMKKGGEKLSYIKHLIEIGSLDIKISDIIEGFINILKNFKKLYKNSANGYLIHNDLSEENITYSIDTNKFYLIDFGASNFIEKDYIDILVPEFIEEILYPKPGDINESIFLGWDSPGGKGVNGTTDLLYDIQRFILYVTEYVFLPLYENVSSDISKNENLFLNFLLDFIKYKSNFTKIMEESESNYKIILEELYNLLKEHLSDPSYEQEIETIYAELKIEQKKQIKIIFDIIKTIELIYFTGNESRNNSESRNTNENNNLNNNIIRIIKGSCNEFGGETSFRIIQRKLIESNIDSKLISNKKKEIKEFARNYLASQDM